jgi:hypothetical protein
MNDDNANSGLKPTSLSVADVARLLSKLGCGIGTQPHIEADIAAGAPTNADGTINLIHYCAWLAQETGHGD